MLLDRHQGVFLGDILKNKSRFRDNGLELPRIVAPFDTKDPKAGGLRSTPEVKLAAKSPIISKNDNEYSLMGK